MITMTKKLNWKLKQLPTASEVADLVHNKIITAEEAKQMLFTESDDKDPTMSELKRQIEFLEGLVTELSKNRSHVNTYVTRYIETKTPSLPNVVWCSGNLGGTMASSPGTVSSTTYANNLIG